MRITQKVLSGAVVAATIVIVASLLSWLRPEQAPQKPDEVLRLVEVGETVARDVKPDYLLTGRLQPVTVSELRFEVAGRIVEENVEVGERVGKGQVLLKLDDGDYRDALVQAQTRLELVEKKLERDLQLLKLAEQNVELRKREVRRIDGLGKKNLSSPSLLDAERQKLVDMQSEQVRLQHATEEGRLNVRLNRSLRDQARRNLERAQLQAPFDSIVNRVEAEIGDYVGKDMVVVELVVADRLDLLLNISNEQAGSLELGLTLEVVVSGRAHAGTLVSLQTDPDRDTYTHAAKIQIEGRGLKAGAAAQTRLPGRSRSNVVAVPVAAVQYVNGQPFLFVEENSVVLRRRVTLGDRAGDEIIVERGLQPGERIVLRDIEGLGNNQKVLVKQAQATPAAHAAER